VQGSKSGLSIDLPARQPSAVRIIGGSASGRRIGAPDGLGVRPMPDKVKLAVFNSLGAFVEGARVLDLFAGVGGLGLECLSRGASVLVSVEKSDRHARCYRDNLTALQLDAAKVERRVADVFQILPRFAREGRTFDLIIADPPYGEKNVGRRSTSLAQRLADSPEVPTMLASGGRFVLGHARRDAIEVPGPWIEVRRLNHGDTIVLFLGLPTPESADKP
jgi:16S rRNA (guanine966-N2)-methyltransferase